MGKLLVGKNCINFRNIMNASDRKLALHRRLDRLDQEMREIREELSREESPGKPAPPPIPEETAVTPPAPPEVSAPALVSSPSPAVAKPKFRPEVWLGRLGIGLLLLGVVFLFQYAFQQGWIVPWLRVGFGAILGGVLVFVSRRVDSSRQWFAHLLAGGGVAVWFATVFAADRLYGLIPGPLALLLTLVLVGLTYRWALSLRSRFLAFFSTLGGLVSPLLLMNGGTVSGIEVLVALIVSAGAMGVYLKRGGIEQVVLVFFLAGLVLAEVGEGDGAVVSRVGFQVGWIAWGLLIMSATWIRHASANAWIPKTERAAALLCPLFVTSSERAGQAGATVWGSVPIVWFLSACALWNLEKVEAGWVGLGLALLTTVLWKGRWSRHQSVPGIREVLLFHAFLFGTAAVILILDGGLQLLVLGIVGWGMIQWGIRHASAWIRVLGNLIMSGVAIWLLVRLVGRVSSPGYEFGLDVAAWVDFLVIGLLLSQALLPWRKWEWSLYWFPGVVFLMTWTAGMLAGLPDRGPWLTCVWAFFGAGSLAVGIRSRRLLFSGTATALLIFVVAKLFLVDLATVDAGWRVLLFLLLGGGFVGLSYLVSRLREDTSPKAESSGEPPHPPELPPSDKKSERDPAAREVQGS